jgi:hypothetical protein
MAACLKCGGVSDEGQNGAGNSDNAAPKRVIGRPFQKGQSGNPQGHSKARRETREKVRAALDAKFEQGDGSDLLVDALVHGVQTGDSTCIKLACEYRWGKPESDVTLHAGEGEPLGIAQVRDAAAEYLADPAKRAAMLAAARGEN